MAVEEGRWNACRVALTVTAVAGLSALWALPDAYRVVTLQPQDIDAVPGKPGLYRYPVAPAIRSLLRWNFLPDNASFLFEGERLLWLRADMLQRLGSEPVSAQRGWHALAGDELLFAPEDGSDPRANGRAYRWEVHGPLQGWRLAGWSAATVSVLMLSLVPGARTGLWLSWMIRAWLAGLAVATLVAWFCPAVPDRIEEASRLSWWGTRVLAHAEDHGPGWALVLAVSGALHTLASRWRGEGAARAELQLRAWLLRWGCPLLVPLCLLSWWKLSAYGPGHRSFSDDTPFSAPFGELLAWSDAASFVSGTLHLVDTGWLDEYSQRRPLNACWGAARLLVTGFNLTGAALLQVVLLGVALHFALAALARRFGSWTWLATWACVWGYARFYLGTALSETLGLTLGAYGFGLLLRSAEGRRPAVALAGLFAMALAQAARLGALFVLPALGCWIAWRSARTLLGRALWLGLAAAVAAAGLGTLTALNHAYGTGANVSGANFAYTLAGLATGRNWVEAMDHYQRELARQPNEGAMARFLYAEAWRHMRAHPEVMAGELVRGAAKFSKELFPNMLMFAEHAATWSSMTARRLITAGLLVLALAGCARTMLGRNGLWGFWLWGMAGVLVSAPFIYLDGGWRVFAPVWPAIAGWFATSLAARHRLPARLPWPAPLPCPSWARRCPAAPHWAILACGLAAAALAPVWAHRLAPDCRRDAASGSSGHAGRSGPHTPGATAAAPRGAQLQRLLLVPAWSPPPVCILPRDALCEEQDSHVVPRKGTAYNRVWDRPRTITWREFQRRLQHSHIGARRELREAAGKPPCTLQQSYDALRRQVVYVGQACRPPRPQEPGPGATTGPWFADWVDLTCRSREKAPYGVTVALTFSSPVIGRMVAPPDR